MSAKPSRALVVIDVQNEYVVGNLPIEYPPVERSLALIGLAMDTASAHGVPVVVVQNFAQASAPLFAKGSVGADLHDVVARRKRDHYIAKTWPSVYAETDFAQWLAERRIDTLTVVGFLTHNCDASTIFEATHRGLKVEFLEDASGAVPYVNAAGGATAEEIHRVFSVVFQSRFAAVATTASWVAAVKAGTPLERETIAASNRRARVAPATA